MIIGFSQVHVVFYCNLFYCLKILGFHQPKKFGEPPFPLTMLYLAGEWGIFKSSPRIPKLGMTFKRLGVMLVRATCVAVTELSVHY